METLYATSVLGFPVDVVLWLFFAYSCAGVLVEGVFSFVLTGRLELRLGLLFVPLRPIYGFGGVACTLFLTPLLAHPVVVFALSAVICSAVEFGSGWSVERAFRTISWDYSEKPLHLRGRICLQYSLCWGLLATAALYACHSVVAEEVQRPGPGPAEPLLTVLMVFTLISVALTLAALARVRRRVDELRAHTHEKPATSSHARWDRLIDHLVPDLVLIHSFPRMSLSAELRELTGNPTAADQGSPPFTARPGNIRSPFAA